MACPVCFFRDSYQKELKERSFSEPRFERKIRQYKENYLAELRILNQLSQCECGRTYQNADFKTWTDAFLAELKNNENEVATAFDDLIAVYDAFISKNQAVAISQLWTYLQTHNLLSRNASWLNTHRILYRARKKDRPKLIEKLLLCLRKRKLFQNFKSIGLVQKTLGRVAGKKGFDEDDIKEYFHMPFSKRHLLGNMRFSVAGQPMVYLGSSVIAVAKELDADIKDLAIAAFVPKFPVYSSKRMFELTNKLNDLIEKSLPGIFSEGSISYEDTTYSSNKNTIKEDIRAHVLAQICTFPTEAKTKGSFVAEYAIPQMLTTALLQHGYDGIVFPSTKNYSELADHHLFSQHHINVGVFVPYEADRDTNEELLETFDSFIYSSPLGLSLDEINKYV
jgi:hypothetical protein